MPSGESFRGAINRLLRGNARAGPPTLRPTLPELPGRPLVDLADPAALLAALDDERRTQRGVT